MQQQTIALSLRVQLFGREPGLTFATAPVGRLDLRFDRFAFPAPCHASLYVARAARESAWFVSFNATREPGQTLWLHCP